MIAVEYISLGQYVLEVLNVEIELSGVIGTNIFNVYGQVRIYTLKGICTKNPCFDFCRKRCYLSLLVSRSFTFYA